MIALLFALAVLVGFLAGVAFRDALDLLLAGPAPAGSIHSHSGRTMRRTLSWIRDNVLTLAVVAAMVMNAALGVILIQGRDDLHKFIGCIAQYEHDKDASTKVRSDAAADVSDAMDRVVNAVYRQDARKFKRAIRHYVTVRAAQEKSRAENPPPDPPSQICGRPV